MTRSTTGRMTAVLERFQASAKPGRARLAVMAATTADERRSLLPDTIVAPTTREIVAFDAAAPTVTIRRRSDDKAGEAGWRSAEPLDGAGRLRIAAWSVELDIADPCSGLLPEHWTAGLA